MALGRPTLRLVLKKEERKELTRLAEARKTPWAEAQRARAVLLSADGFDDKEVGRRVGFSNATAGKWRKRYASPDPEAAPGSPGPG